MKRIILFLALLSLGVSKAQVVGGYLPVNSTKSATMGGLRVNGNETVTGIFSVGSTATVSGNALFSSSVGIGALPSSSLSAFQLVKGTGSLNIGSSDGSGVSMWGNVTPSASNYLIYSNGASSIMNGTTTARLSVGGNEKVYCTSTGVKINSSSTPNSALDVNGSIIASGTFSLGSANLTGGNTGTVAVLSDAIFNVFCFASSSSIADATTYYFGNSGYNLIGSTSNGNITLPNNCTLIGWDLNAVTSGANSTTETATISISGATNYTLTTAATYTSAYLNLSGTSLSQDFNAGDKVLIKVLSPTFATNPSGVYHGITLWFRRRT